VHGEPRGDSVARAVRNPRRGPRLPSGAAPAAAPPVALREIETELRIPSGHYKLE